MYLQEISLILLIIFQINFIKYHYSSIRNVQYNKSKISIDCVTFFGTRFRHEVSCVFCRSISPNSYNCLLGSRPDVGISLGKRSSMYGRDVMPLSGLTHTLNGDSLWHDYIIFCFSRVWTSFEDMISSPLNAQV